MIFINPNQISNKRKLIIVLLVVTVVLCIIVCVLHTLKTIQNYNTENSRVRTISYNKSETEEENKNSIVNSHKEIEAISGDKNSEELNLVFLNNWSREGLKLQKEVIDEDKDNLYYDGFRLNLSNLLINYIEFNSDYKDKIYEKIKVGDSLSQIEKKLGKPTFRGDGNFIGYKDVDLYLFFFKDKVVSFPTSSNFSTSNLEFEQLLMDYYNGKYENERSLFVKKIIDKFSDFQSTLIEDGVKVSSYLRGVEFYLYDDEKIEITIYDNYKIITDEMKKLAEEEKINLEYDTDSVYSFVENDF